MIESRFSYDDKVAKLAPMEEFAKEAFVAHPPDYPDSVCRLILTLAVVHNDMNDIDFAITLLKNKTPQLPVSETLDWALHNGIGLHLARQKIGLVHELLRLIRENLNAVGQPAFAKLTRGLSKRNRGAWEEVLEAAGGKARDTPLGKFLAHCRDKTAGHYDAKVHYASYLNRFADSSMRPLISRGNSMYTTRFHFADAAAEHILFGGSSGSQANTFLFGGSTLPDSINLALFFLVTGFVTMRGFAWKKADRGRICVNPY